MFVFINSSYIIKFFSLILQLNVIINIGKMLERAKLSIISVIKEDKNFQFIGV